MQPGNPPPLNKKLLSGISIGIFILLSAALFWFVGRPMVAFFAEPERFRAWVQGHGLWGKAAFVGMMVLQIVIAIIPGEPLEIGAGYAFGAVEGTLLCLVACVIGTALVYLFVKKWGVRAVEVFFPLEKIQDNRLLKNPKRLNLLVFLAFFIPGTPKDMLTYLVGLTKMRLWPLLLITFFARIPSIITSTIGGDALGMQDYTFAILVFSVTILISVIGIIVFNRMYKKDKESSV